MIRLVFGEDNAVAAYVGEKIGSGFSPPLATIGMTRDGQTLCGGAVFHNYTGANIDMGLALDVPLNRGLMRALHNYVFEQLKALRCTAITKRSKKKNHKMLKRFGFQFEGVSPRYFGPKKSDDGFRFVFFSDTGSKFL